MAVGAWCTCRECKEIFRQRKKGMKPKYCSDQCRKRYVRRQDNDNKRRNYKTLNGRPTDAERKAMGMRPYEPGIKLCTQCERPFKSWDIRENQICKRCQYDIKENPCPPEFRSATG